MATFFQDHALPGRCWRHGERTFTQIFDSLQHRVDQCMRDSEAYQELSAEANQLWRAMDTAPITDTRRNFAGERHRVLTRAQALRTALEERDPSLHHVPWSAPLTQPHTKGCDPPCVQKTPEEPPKASMDDEEVSPQCALLSACLLQSALFEGTAHADPELRRRVFADFTMLKREFRHSVTRVLHGPTTSVGELFGSVKDLDKEGLCDNIQGIIFDDWTVHRRVDAFLRSDLDCEATCLTQEGPIGRIHCRLRTFLTLAVLQERLLRDLFATRFCTSPVRGLEPMTLDDPLDFYDFLEAMTRNTPNAYASSRGLYYAWLYAPEVNATPERWERIFGPGANRLPCLYDGITTPDSAVVSDPKSDSGYSMELPVAAQHEYEHAGAQAAVGYPWADDLLGRYLKRMQATRAAKQAQAAGQSPAVAAGAAAADGERGGSGDEEESVGTVANNEGLLLHSEAPCGSGGANAGSGQAGCKPEPGCEDCEQPPAKRIKCEAGAEGQAAGMKQEAEARGAVAGPGPSSEATAAAAADGKAGVCGAGKGPACWSDRERLPLPLGIFLVGIITSSAFTNTQIHIEDLMLMSININIFGCPKIWWWIPKQNVPRFKRFAESLSGSQDLYTKAVAPFVLNKSVQPYEHKLSLAKLKEFGARRVIQMPGMAILTSPGYAFHFTVSMGLNLAESCNMFLEMMGWTVERLWKERPLEQYPDPENSMAKWMHEHGVLDALGVEPGKLHRGPEDKEAALELLAEDEEGEDFYEEEEEEEPEEEDE